VTEFERETVARLDRIESLLSTLTGDTDTPLLREIVRVFGSQAFVARQVTAAAEMDPRLREALEDAVGLPSATRRLGKLLARCDGISIGGVLVCRVGDSHAGGVWSAKLILPVAPRLHAVQHGGTNDRG